MEVYIVMAGSYSDTRIVKVFLDKEKAETYVKLSQGGYDPAYLRVMETSDCEVITKITYVEAYYTKAKDYEGIEVDILVTNTLDWSEDGLKRNDFFLYPSGTKELNIAIVINDEYEEDMIKEKYEKVCRDLMSQIESLIEIEGWSETMVNEWLGQNVDKYLSVK